MTVTPTTQVQHVQVWMYVCTYMDTNLHSSSSSSDGGGGRGSFRISLRWHHSRKGNINSDLASREPYRSVKSVLGKSEKGPRPSAGTILSGLTILTVIYTH